MNLTYGDARAIVQAYLSVGGSSDLTTAPGGREDATGFYVPYEHVRFVEFGDPAYLLCGGSTFFVDKATGDIEVCGAYLPGEPHADRIDRMTAV